jgi:hypothetical protein
VPKVFPESRILAVNPGAAYVLLHEPEANRP